ncbi:hypothetical protein BGZ65_002270, partial [Modicella reniformis]
TKENDMRTSSSSGGDLSPENGLKLATFHLENARKTTDPDLALLLYKEAEMVLARIGRSKKEGLPRTDCYQDQSAREAIANVTSEVDQMSTGRKEVKDLGNNNRNVDPNNNDMHPADGAPTEKVPAVDSIFLPSQDQHAGIASYIFTDNRQPPVTVFKLPEPDERLQDTAQLAYCLKLLKLWSSSPDDIQDQTSLDWLHALEKDEDERGRLKTLGMDVIKAFAHTNLNDANAVAEVMCLVPVLEKDDFHHLLGLFYNDIERSVLLDSYQLEGIAQLIQCAGPDYLTAAILVKILEHLKDHLSVIHQQRPSRVYQLTLMVSNVLDSMVDAGVKGLDRKRVHESLSTYLDGLKSTSDAFLVYQAAYAYQSLKHILDEELLWKTALQSTGRKTHDQPTTANTAHVVDLDEFLEGLSNVQNGLSGVLNITPMSALKYKGIESLEERGQMFLECLNKTLSFECRQAWYPALRMADVLLRGGYFADFRKLICEAPCRLHPAFQWGLCQRLGDLAVNSKWDAETRQNAVALLEEICQCDAVWGEQATIKQWIVGILMQVTSAPHAVNQSMLTGEDSEWCTLFYLLKSVQVN